MLNHGRDAAFLALTDRPPVLPITLTKLREAFFNADPVIWAVVPEVQRGAETVHGHPILIGREMMEAFLRAPLDANARDLEHQHQQHIEYLPVDDLRAIANIDTPEDYQRLSRADMISSEKQF